MAKGKSNDDDKLAPFLADAVKAYSAMEAQAETDEETGLLVWEGSTVKYFQSIGIDQTRYTYLIRILKRMGCVTMIRRGGNKVPSQWSLDRQPTEELFNEHIKGSQFKYYGESVTNKAQRQEHQQIRDVNERLTRLEDLVQRLLDAQ